MNFLRQEIHWNRNMSDSIQILSGRKKWTFDAVLCVISKTNSDFRVYAKLLCNFVQSNLHLHLYDQLHHENCNEGF